MVRACQSGVRGALELLLWASRQSGHPDSEQRTDRFRPPLACCGHADRERGVGHRGQEERGGASYSNPVAGEAASLGGFQDRGAGGPELFSSRYTNTHVLLLAAPGLSGGKCGVFLALGSSTFVVACGIYFQTGARRLSHLTARKSLQIHFEMRKERPRDMQGGEELEDAPRSQVGGREWEQKATWHPRSSGPSGVRLGAHSGLK